MGSVEGIPLWRKLICQRPVAVRLEPSEAITYFSGRRLPLGGGCRYLNAELVFWVVEVSVSSFRWTGSVAEGMGVALTEVLPCRKRLDVGGCD